MVISKQTNGFTWIDKTHHGLNSQKEHSFPYSMLCDSPYRNGIPMVFPTPNPNKIIIPFFFSFDSHNFGRSKLQNISNWGLLMFYVIVCQEHKTR
jgi:hypothetical protein